MEWSFKYIGPKSPIDERDCAICSTVARKRCAHHTSHTTGCSHCDAVRDGICAAHCGIHIALNRHNVAECDPLNFRWVPTGAVTVGAAAGGATFGTQERRETKMTQEKADRIRKAAAQFSAAGAYILAQCAQFPECRVDITAKGDDLGAKFGGIEISIIALGAEEYVEDDAPEVDAPVLGSIVAQTSQAVGVAQ